MPDTTFVAWPFFDDSHRSLAGEIGSWAHVRSGVRALGDARALGRSGVRALGSVDEDTIAWVRDLGTAGWLRYVVPSAYGGARDALDVRSICLIRESLAYQSGLADFAFAMQGLGSGPITLFGDEAQKRKYLPRVARGEAIAAFAISEKEAGSDVSALQCTARHEADGWRLDGEKAWISNAGIADHYVVFCRVPDSGERSFAAYIVEADNPGLRVSERVEVIAPHVLGSLTLEDCRVTGDALIGGLGAGLKVALGTLDVFRTTVAAAALGFARRALDEAVAYARDRQAFGKALAEHQLTQARIAEMALSVDAAALLVYRAAWTRDTCATRITREAAMAKLFATESAQRVIDDAVQLHGGRGVVCGEVVERLYREIRALRIYEGTSEIQKLVIAGQVFGK